MAERGKSTGIPIAIDADNTIRVSTAALGEVRFTPVNAAKADEPLQLDIVPVQNAFVICVSLTHRSEALRFGRTNELGWILECEESELFDAPEPVERAGTFRRLYSPFTVGDWSGPPKPLLSNDQMVLLAGGEYKLYWTHSREQCAELVTALKRDKWTEPRGALSKKIAFRPRRPTEFFENTHRLPYVEAKKTTNPLAILEPDQLTKVDYLLMQSEHNANVDGYLVGHQEGNTICVFDVTPEPLRVLYLCEFLQWWLLAAQKALAQDLATLMRAKDLVHAAYKGLPEQKLESQFRAQPKTPEREVLDMFREYVWQCAANGIDEEILAESLNITVGNVDDVPATWRTAADDIRQSTKRKALHPIFRGMRRERLVLDGPVQLLLLDYFGMYRLGARHRTRKIKGSTLVAHIDRALAHHEEELSLCNGRIRDMIDNRVSLDTLLEVLGLALPDDTEQRLAIVDRFFLLCASVEAHWWKDSTEYRPDVWKDLSMRAGWLTKVCGGVSEVFKGFLDRDLKRYKLAIDEANDALTDLVRRHAAWTGNFESPAFTHRIQTAKAEVEIDLIRSSVTVLKAGDDEVSLQKPLEMYFMVVEDAPYPGTAVKSRQAYRPGAGRNSVQTYEVEVPGDVKRARQFGIEIPAGVIAACNSLGLLFGTLGAIDELKQGVKLERKNLEAWYELGKNTLGVVESLATLEDALAPKIAGYSPLLSRLTPAITAASRATLVIDAGYNLYTGFELLYSETGAVAYEARQGRTARSVALQVKGYLQIGSAVGTGVLAGATLLSFGGASAVGALAICSGPVGLLVGAGSLAILAIDSTLELTKEFGPQTLEFEEALDKALATELDPEIDCFLATHRLRGARQLAIGSLGTRPVDPWSNAR